MIKDKKPEKIILDFTYAEDAEIICKQINRTGIPCIIKEQDVGEHEKAMQNVGPDDSLARQDILYITDDAGKALMAKTAGEAVLIYFHEDNKAEHFHGCRFYIEGFEDADATYYTKVYQREKRIPWTICETKRLVIREMTAEDTEALFALYEDKSVVKYMEDLPENMEEEREYIKDYIDKVYGVFGFGMWLIVLKDTEEIIGRVGFQNLEVDFSDEKERQEACLLCMEEKETEAFWESREAWVELGFLIASKYQKKGYAYEACEAAIAYMKEEFPEYKRMARCKKENAEAIRLCKKLEIAYWLV